MSDTDRGSVATTRTNSRREQILSAAAELFAIHGYHGVGIDEIGAAVGISGPALYRHFRSKEAMLAQMLTSISDILLAGGQRRQDSSAAVDELIHFHVQFALDNPSLIVVQERNLAHLAAADRRRVRGQQRRYVEVWVQAIRRYTDEVDEATARAAAHAIFGLINSTPHSHHLDRTELAQLLTDMAQAAIQRLGTSAQSVGGGRDGRPGPR